MKVNGKHYQSVWADFASKEIYIVNQAILPYRFEIKTLRNTDEVIEAIKTLEVRGAPAIGITAAYALWLSYSLHNGNLDRVKEDKIKLFNSRPTAVNLSKGLEFVWEATTRSHNEELIYSAADTFAQNEIQACFAIGTNGIALIEQLYHTNGRPINILTHCNAGWLACGDYGTALAPIFEAHRRNIPVHVWVDETRPLNQGSRLTAWELHHEQIPYHIIADNTGGLLMMKDMVDMVIVGADRIAANGDVANKIGTYLKALAAHRHCIPFYVAAPLSTFDFTLNDGQQIIIEERNPEELRKIISSQLQYVDILPDDFRCLNYAFDITPADLITAYITERGIVKHCIEIKSKS